MKTVDKLMKILKEGGSLIAGTVKRDIQQGKATSHDERLVNYMFLKGVAVLPLPGTRLWYIEKDGDGKYCEISCAKFVALGRDCVVLAQVNPEELIKECEKYFDCQSDVFVLPVGDVFEKETDAEAELQKRREHYDN